MPQFYCNSVNVRLCVIRNWAPRLHCSDNNISVWIFRSDVNNTKIKIQFTNSNTVSKPCERKPCTAIWIIYFDMQLPSGKYFSSTINGHWAQWVTNWMLMHRFLYEISNRHWYALGTLSPGKIDRNVKFFVKIWCNF